MNSLFVCPHCGGPLERGERAYACPSGHSFDIAREGYVHLLPANRKHAKNPGDDKGMASARSRFLSGGYYAPLRDALCGLAGAYAGPEEGVLDSGCGEGYYTAGLWEALNRPRLAGIDLSKPSVRLAARRVPGAEFAVASVYHLPPGAGHLWELKQVLYDSPYPNKEENIPYEGFSYEKVVPVETVMDVAGEDLRDLFQMTPYYWKTPKAGAERLAALDGLRVRAQFRIHVFQKI